MKKMFFEFLEMKNLPLADKALIYVHVFSFSGNLVAWLEQNKVFATNLIFVIVPGAIYALYRFRQKYRHQEALNRIELHMKLNRLRMLENPPQTQDEEAE